MNKDKQEGDKEEKLLGLNFPHANIELKKKYLITDMHTE